MALKLVLLLIILFIILVGVFNFGGGNMGVERSEEDINYEIRWGLLSELNFFVEDYYIRNKKYPRYLTDIRAVVPNDPINGRADWEVCNYKNKNVWYRTSNIDYDPNIKLWNPEPESGIFEVRPHILPSDRYRLEWLNYSIEHYHVRNKKYPRYLTDIDISFPIDIATGFADWEVCDYKNENLWYRTSNADNTSYLKLWNPRPEDGIYKIRSRKGHQ